MRCPRHSGKFWAPNAEDAVPTGRRLLHEGDPRLPATGPLLWGAKGSREPSQAPRSPEGLVIMLSIVKEVCKGPISVTMLASRECTR